MLKSPNSLDINIKSSTNNANTHINFNFNINSTLNKKFLSPPFKILKEPPSSITGRKIDNSHDNILNYESNSLVRYPILIEDSKRKTTTTKAQISLKKSPRIKTKSLGKLTGVSLLEKARITSKTRALLSPTLNFDEKPRVTPKEQVKPKKKSKSKSKVSLKKKKRQIPKDVNQNTQTLKENLSHFQEFVKKNVKKYNTQKVFSKQKKHEEIQQRIIKQQSLHLQNQAIRKLNSNFSSHKNALSVPKFPWGFDQKKFINFFEKTAETNSLKSTQKKPNSLWLDDKTRREQMGLGFLNEMNFEDFQRIVDKQKHEINEEIEDNKKIQKETNPEIINWMVEKKKKIEEERWNSIKGLLEEQQRIRKNMQELDIKVANSRNSVKYSVNNQNNRSNYAKSTHYQTNQDGYSNHLNNYQPRELVEKEENQIYDMIQNQYQQMVYSSSNRNEQEQQDFSSSRHFKSKSADLPGKILQKRRNIQEKFQILSQKMANTLGVIKGNSLSPSPETQNYQQKLEINDQNSNRNYPQNQNPSQNESNNTENSKNIVENPLQNQLFELQNPRKPQSESHKTPPSKKQKEQEAILEEAIEFSSEEEEMIFIINTAATLIQKVWKGYRTRKMLNFYVVMALKEMNPEFSNTPKKITKEETPTPKKPISKIMRRSHSLDEIYEPGNLFKENESNTHKNEKTNKMEAIFNEEEREELNKKLSLLNNKSPEEFDYYQLGEKFEEVQFDIKASEGVPKVIDNNLFYGKNNEAKLINNATSELVVKKDQSEQNISVNEKNINRQRMLSDKNIQISNMGSLSNLKERKGSLENDQPEELKEIFNEPQNLIINRNPEKNPLKWEEFIDYMKLCCQRTELNETAQKFLETLQTLPLSSLKTLVNPSERKDEEIQTSIKSITLGKNLRKNLMIEIEDYEESEESEENNSNNKNKQNAKKQAKKQEEINSKKSENIQKKKIIEEIKENDDQEKNTDINLINSKLGELRRAVGSEQLLRTQSLSLNPSPADINRSSTIFELDPFREFTSKKIREFLNKENMLKLIRYREKALLMRHKAQIELMKKMLDNNRVSPRTFQSKSEEIEKWVSLEREDMLRKKLEIEKGWLSAALTMRRTQRDLMFMQKSLGKQEKISLLSFKHSFSEEDLEMFEGIDDKDKGKSMLDQQVHRLEIQDEVLKDSNEKNKDPILIENSGEIFVNGKVLPFNFEKDQIEENLNKQITSESCNTNSPKILLETIKNPLEHFKNTFELTNTPFEAFKIPFEIYKSPSDKSPSDSFKANFESLKIKSEKNNNYTSQEPAVLDILKKKIAEIPKILSHEDFGTLSGSSGAASLSNSKSEVMFLTSKNKENEKKIEQISGLIFEQLVDELKTDTKILDMLKLHKITVHNSQKSPKTEGFVAGKDIQEHFPPLNSPSREDIGNKRLKEQIISPKNLSYFNLILTFILILFENLDQYRVKSEPDEKTNKGNYGILSNIEAVKEYSNELIELIKSFLIYF